MQVLKNTEKIGFANVLHGRKYTEHEEYTMRYGEKHSL